MLSLHINFRRCFLWQKQIFAAKFDTRFSIVIIGCHQGFLLNGDFLKNGHFPPFTIPFGLAGSELHLAK